MYAKIIPLRRLPRGIDVLDYVIPQELEATITPGQLVSIPIRTSQHFGIVLSMDAEQRNKEIADKPLKELIAIVHTTPIVSPRHIHVWRILAAWYGTSLGTIAKMSLLPLQKRKIQSIRLEELRHPTSKPEATECLYSNYANEAEHQKLLQQNIGDGQTLILVPTVNLIDQVLALLPEHDDDIVIWHSRLSVKEQFEHWLQIRNGEKRIIIGTRGATLLPFFNLQNIIIDFEHHKEHKHWDQNPRLHVKDVAELLSAIFGARTLCLSSTPSVESFVRTDNAREVWNIAGCHPTIVDMRSQRGAGDYSPFSPQVSDIIKNAQTDVLLLLNRRGFARSLTCIDCGYVNTCDGCHLPYIYHEKENQLHCHYCNRYGKILLVCPTCGSGMVKLRGMGTELIEKEAKKIAPDSHTVVLVDAETELMAQTGPRILVGTHAAALRATWSDTEAVILIDIDTELALPDYQIEEQLYHTILNITYCANESTPLLLQTLNPEHVFFHYLADPWHFYEKTKSERKALSYPPSTYMVRYLIASPFKSSAEHEASRLYTKLHGILTNGKKNITLSHPIEMHPRFYRGKHWYAILVRLEPETWKNDLIWLNTYIPKECRIDPRPNSILSF